MSAHYSTTVIFDVLRAQIAEEVADAANAVIRFDGNIVDAIDDHFQQATDAGLKAAVFVGFADEFPETLGGTGQTIRPGFLVDAVCVVRSDGRSRYTSDLDRLYDLSDIVAYDAFEFANTNDDYRAHIAAAKSIWRRRLPALDPYVMAHVVRFDVIPRTP
jgi:hypothetical protein